MGIVAQRKLDWTAYRALQPAVARAVAAPGRASIRIDLSGVTSLEPGGVGALVVLHELAASKLRGLVLDGVDPRFDALLRGCGLALADAPAVAQAAAHANPT